MNLGFEAYLLTIQNDFLHAAKSYDMGPTVLIPPEGRHAAHFYHPQKSITLARSEPANLGSNGKHANHYTTEATAFWDIPLCSLVEVDQGFRGLYSIYHQGNDEGSADNSTRGSIFLCSSEAIL
jgi:hypothetical protein